MVFSTISRRRTRREFLSDAIRLGAGAAALAALGPQSTPSASAAGARPERVEVLLEDIVEAASADFARGQAHGVEIAAEAGGAALRGKRGGVFTSGVRALSFSATHLGLHWVVRGASPDSLSVEVRSSADGTAWSDWQRLSIEAIEELPAGVEVFASLVEGRRGRFVQYRVSFGSDQVTTIDKVTITSLNSVDGPREPLAAVQSAPVTIPTAAGAVTVTTREEWGCDETLRFRRKAEIWPEMYVPAKKVVLHHTATSNGYSDGAAEVRAIYTYHARTLGWGDIGYNSLIDRFGRVYEGRHGKGEGVGREILSTDVVAGHTLSHNYGSTGIAVIGNFNDVLPDSSLLGRIADVMTFECGRHCIDPSGASDFLRTDDTWHAGLNKISGHSESYNTDCPGTNLKARLSDLRQAVASRFQSGPALTLTGVPTDYLTALAEPATLSFSVPLPCDYCLEGWYKPTTSDNITYLSGYVPGGYGDALARVQAWTPATTATPEFTGLTAGHYTMHVRASSGNYEANLTFLVKKSSTPGKPPKK